MSIDQVWKTFAEDDSHLHVVYRNYVFGNQLRKDMSYFLEADYYRI